MVRILSVSLLLAAVSASASPAIPSFEFSAAQLQSSIAAMRAAQITAAVADLSPRIQQMAWEVETAERETSRLKTDLTFLLMRVRRYQPPSNGRSSNDPSLRWDVQRFTQELSRVTRDAQWRVNDLRYLTAQAVKDETLVAPASRLSNAAARLKSAASWLQMDARFGYFELMARGFVLEGMDLDRDSRDLDRHAEDTDNEADRLLAKVRG